jgi:PST family polysaccharide transporter
LNKIFKNTAALFGSQLAGYAISLLILPYISRALGVSGFGEWSFSMNAMTYVAVILEFGFTLYGAKKIAESQNSAGEIAANIYIAKITLAALCFLIISILPSGIASTTVWYSAFFVSFAQSLSPIWLFQGFGLVRFIAIFTIAAQAVAALLIVLFVKTPSDIALTIQIYAFCFALSNIIAIIYAVKKFSIKISPTKKFYTLYIDAKNIFLSNIAITIYVSMIGLVVGFTLNAKDAGEFFGAQKIVLIINALFVPLSQALYPMCSQNKNAKFIQKLLLVAFVAVGFFCIILAILSNQITLLILGSQFNEAATLLAICAFAPLFVALNTIMGTLGLIAFGYEKHMRQITVVAAIISAPLAFYLCSFGIFGAAIYIPLIEALVFVSLVYKTKKLGII